MRGEVAAVEIYEHLVGRYPATGLYISDNLEPYPSNKLGSTTSSYQTNRLLRQTTPNIAATIRCGLTKVTVQIAKNSEILLSVKNLQKGPLRCCHRKF